MPSLYETLQGASQAERLGIATELVTGMQAGNPAANHAYYSVCRDVARNLSVREADTDGTLERWEFSAFESAMLVTSVRRVGGFLRAIDRAPQAGTVVEAGCGSTAVLSVAAAVSHPRSEVVAYEVVEPAARCATAMIDLMGLSDRIQVRTEDVLMADLPDAELAVTETFASGLTKEMGTRLTEALGRNSREVLPRFAQLYATDNRVPRYDPDVIWQETTLVDLADRNDMITGVLASLRRGRIPVSVYAEFLDARGEEVVGWGVKDLTDPVTLGSIVAPRIDTTIHFSYPAGTDLDVTPAQLWVGQR